MPISDKMHYDQAKGKWVWNESPEVGVAKWQEPAGAPNIPFNPSTAPAAPQPSLNPDVAPVPPKDLTGGPEALTVDNAGNIVQNTPVTGTEQLDRYITPENTLINQRIGLDAREIDTTMIDKLAAAAGRGGAGVGQSAELQALLASLQGDVEGGMNREDIVRRQFESNLPFLDERFEDSSRMLAERTSAMGRTGGGFVDRDFADLDLREKRGREAMLGQLTSQAAQQEIADRIGLYNAGTGLTGVQAGRDIANAQQLNSARGVGLQALLGAAGLDLQGQNIGVNTDFRQADFLQRERQYEYGMSRDAMSDEAMRLEMAQTGFGSDPTGQLNTTSTQLGRTSEQYGVNAGDINATLGQNAQAQAAQPTPSTTQVYGAPKRLTMPRTKYPGSTIDLNPITRRPTDMGGL
jgi:hypothetical protein